MEERLAADEPMALDEEVPKQLAELARVIGMKADRVAEAAPVAKRGWQQRSVDECTEVEGWYWGFGVRHRSPRGTALQECLLAGGGAR